MHMYIDVSLWYALMFHCDIIDQCDLHIYIDVSLNVICICILMCHCGMH